MSNEEIMKHIDHTNLQPYATWDDIKQLCEEALEYKVASICIQQSYIKRVKDEYGDSINICTVVGFPLGYQLCESKVLEARESINLGANEIDMVINITDVKNGDFDKVLTEIKAVKEACGGKLLKVIIETCYLTNDEKIKMCQIVTLSGADYIKTSTGFGTGGATIEDVKLMKDNVGANVKVKAAGGVKTREDMVDFISIGADRIGSSSAIKILKGVTTAGY